MVQQVHCSRRRLPRRELEFHVCTINKSTHTKKSLETYRMHLVQTDSLIPARRPDIVMLAKKKKKKKKEEKRACHLLDFAVPVDYWGKIKESEKIEKILEFCQRVGKKQQKTAQLAGSSGTNCSWYSWNSPQMFGKRVKEMEIRGRIHALLRLKCAEESRRPEESFRYSREKPPANTWMKNSQRDK